MKLNLTSFEDQFIFEADESITSIWIEKNDKVILEKDDNAFYIHASKILNLLEKNTEDRAKIFFTTSTSDSIATEFSIHEHSEISVNGPLTLEIEKELISLYITLDGYLRFISNQAPSASSYFESATLKKINNNNNTVLLEITAISKIFEIDTANLIIKNRKSNNTLTFNPINKESSIVNNKIQTHLIYEIDIQNISTLLDDINYYSYDATVLDTFFSPLFKYTDTTIRQFKIQRPTDLNEEVWFEFDGFHLLLKNYGTEKFENLAFRTSFLDDDAFYFYQNLEKKYQKHQNTRKIILISEYPHKAQDNGLHMFNFINSNYSDILDCYFILEKDSKDLTNLSKYKEKVITFKSKEHFKIILKTDMILHTHSSNYALPLVTNFMEKYYQNIQKIFLQHGIIGERDLTYLYGKNTNPTFTNKFIISSHRERKIVENELGYSRNDILLTGLARFDSLLKDNSPKKSYELKNKILIMPSWRQGEDNLSEKEFMQTIFYSEFMSLLSNPKLNNLIKEHSLEVSFYLHTNFQKYRHLFESDTISILKEGESNVQDLLKNNGILITDYSSVGLDFSLLDRPVIYYQFDTTLKESRKQKKRFLPGPIVKNQEELLNILQKKINKNKISPIYKLRRKRNLYLYNDTNAKKRIVNEILKLLN